MAAKPIDPEKLVSIRDIAIELGYHPNYLQRLAVSGAIEAWRIGNVWATTRERVNTYVKAHPKKSSKPRTARGGRSGSKK